MTENSLSVLPVLDPNQHIVGSISSQEVLELIIQNAQPLTIHPRIGDPLPAHRRGDPCGRPTSQQLSNHPRGHTTNQPRPTVRAIPRGRPGRCGRAGHHPLSRRKGASKRTQMVDTMRRGMRAVPRGQTDSTHRPIPITRQIPRTPPQQPKTPHTESPSALNLISHISPIANPREFK